MWLCLVKHSRTGQHRGLGNLYRSTHTFEKRIRSRAVQSHGRVWRPVACCVIIGDIAVSCRTYCRALILTHWNRFCSTPWLACDRPLDPLTPFRSTIQLRVCSAFRNTASALGIRHVRAHRTLLQAPMRYEAARRGRERGSAVEEDEIGAQRVIGHSDYVECSRCGLPTLRWLAQMIPSNALETQSDYEFLCESCRQALADGEQDLPQP